MSRPLTFTDRRRAKLAQRPQSLEAMEPRSMITESLGIMMLGIGVPSALASQALQAGNETKPSTPTSPPSSRRIYGDPVIPFRNRKNTASELVATPNPITVSYQAPARPANDWLTLIRPITPQPADDSLPGLTPPQAKSSANAGGQTASRGGASGGSTANITPLQLPRPTQADSSNANAAAAASIATSANLLIPSPGSPKISSTAPSSPAGASGLNFHPADSPPPSISSAPPVDPGIYTNPLSPPPQVLGKFTNFPLYVLDWNQGTTFFPGTMQYANFNASFSQPGQTVELRAQARDASGVTFSWNTSGLSNASSITTDGPGNYRLRFYWNGNHPAAGTESITLTATDSLGHQEVQTLTYYVPTHGSTVMGMLDASATWPQSLAPNTVLSDAPSFVSHNVSADANSGALDTSIALPTYNPNLPGLSLTYDSLVANPLPIVTVPHVLDPTLSVPTQVSGKLTFNGTAGTTYYYNTSQFTAGDDQQIALQANATALSTGRYAYTAAIGDIRGTTTTTNLNGTATVLNGISNAFGSGWTLQGLEQITTATGGVILDLGNGGNSLWFSGSGTYTDPAGEFSTLADVSGGGYIRTLTDGTVYRFNSSGQETSVADRNGLRVTFTYSGGNLSTVTDPYNKVTTFAYSGGLLSTITDPASRITTFTHSGTDLTAAQLPDGNTWNYGYDGSHRLTQVTDPRSKTVTVTYDSAERTSTITRPDSTTEEVSAFQEQGWTNSGTSGSPAIAILLAQAAGSYTDPNGNTSAVRPDWNGQGLPDVANDPGGNIWMYDRDSNGLATIAIDRDNRITQYGYDTKGNIGTITYFDGNVEKYAYNSFAEPTSHTDANNHTATYTYDGNGNLTVVKDALSNLTTLTYTGNGKVATVKDARTNVTSYQYDSQDRLTTVTYPDNSTTLIAYDAKGNAATITDERGNSTTFAYDALNRLTGKTDALGNRSSYTYDASGNLTVDQEPLSRTTTYAYDVMDRVTTVTDPLSHNTVYGYDSAGNLKTVTDPLSRVTTFAYDAENRPTVVTDPLGNSTTTAYDAEGQALTVTDPLNRVTTYTYNARGWTATVTDPLTHITTYGYTATGKPSTVTNPNSSGGSTESYHYDNDDRLIADTDANNNTTTYGYDAVGNRITVTDALSHVTSFAYDSRNRLTTATDPLSHVTVYGYDSGGNQTTVTDPLSHTTTTQYDALNRATTMTDARSGVTVLVFDSAGRNTVVVDPVSNRTTFAYDAADRLTTMTDPLSHSVTYSYDNANQLTSKTDRDGRQTTYSYDSGGRQTGETWVSASPAEMITYTYDADNELTNVVDTYSNLTFTYDSGGRQLAASTSVKSAGTITLNSSYDPFGNRTNLTDNLSSIGRTTFTYDGAFRLTAINASYGGTSGPTVSFVYDNANRLTSESRTIGASGTAVATTFSYDNADRLTTITDQITGGARLATYVYGYDNANRVTSETNAEGTVSYTYDATNELTGASGSRAETYTYDLNGNRTMTGYSTGSGNELTASPGVTYTYDNEGNMTAAANTSTHVVTSYTYDYHNRLIGVSVGGTAVATYVYDARDRRIGIQDNGTQTWVVWDGQNPYADFNGSGTLTMRYVYGRAVDELLARTSSGGTTAWYLTDRLGTVRDIVSTSGTALDHVVYDSFGNVTSESNAANGDRFKFTGREFDSVTGLQYNRARMYAPSIGRWTSQDPMEFSAGDADLYRYVQNTPTNSVDPTGSNAQLLSLTVYGELLYTLSVLRSTALVAAAAFSAYQLRVYWAQLTIIQHAQENAQYKHRKEYDEKDVGQQYEEILKRQASESRKGYRIEIEGSKQADGQELRAAAEEALDQLRKGRGLNPPSNPK